MVLPRQHLDGIRGARGAAGGPIELHLSTSTRSSNRELLHLSLTRLFLNQLVRHVVAIIMQKTVKPLNQLQRCVESHHFSDRGHLALLVGLSAEEHLA